MPKSNMADSGYEGEILGFNNVELSQEEAKALVDWMANSHNCPESVRNLGELIETCYNLGDAHTEDTKEKTVVILAADYVIADDVDPEEDAVEEEKVTDGQPEESPT